MYLGATLDTQCVYLQLCYWNFNTYDVGICICYWSIALYEYFFKSSSSDILETVASALRQAGGQTDTCLHVIRDPRSFDCILQLDKQSDQPSALVGTLGGVLICGWTFCYVTEQTHSFMVFTFVLQQLLGFFETRSQV